MLAQLLAGAMLIAASVAIHAFVLDRLALLLRRLEARHPRPLRLRWRFYLLLLAALGAFLSHVVQVWIWAVVFMVVGEFATLEPALYFSTSTFTTVGYGDVTMSEKWRLLASFEGAGGMLLFGLSTAFLFEVMRRVWQRIDLPPAPEPGHHSHDGS
ncbi:potassium channel family protein [Ferruginivarius sediminum]|uniref:Two pore domain potassium channel family protein n=1 Tax=Ferruginivarius sediminum TaxID=2661937 RepID=A0A369T5V6_9PROT|nr:potassium channel family protein [Ferruginivarius sediminum]RDD60701.1 two pore domain potassium channel family protein [Ferruginivarius sediminum]